MKQLNSKKEEQVKPSCHIERQTSKAKKTFEKSKQESVNLEKSQSNHILMSTNAVFQKHLKTMNKPVEQKAVISSKEKGFYLNNNPVKQNFKKVTNNVVEVSIENQKIEKHNVQGEQRCSNFVKSKFTLPLIENVTREGSNCFKKKDKNSLSLVETCNASESQKRLRKNSTDMQKRNTTPPSSSFSPLTPRRRMSTPESNVNKGVQNQKDVIKNGKTNQTKLFSSTKKEGLSFVKEKANPNQKNQGNLIVFPGISSVKMGETQSSKADFKLASKIEPERKTKQTESRVFKAPIRLSSDELLTNQILKRSKSQKDKRTLVSVPKLNQSVLEKIDDTKRWAFTLLLFHTHRDLYEKTQTKGKSKGTTDEEHNHWSHDAVLVTPNKHNAIKPEISQSIPQKAQLINPFKQNQIQKNENECKNKPTTNCNKIETKENCKQLGQTVSNKAFKSPDENENNLISIVENSNAQEYQNYQTSFKFIWNSDTENNGTATPAFWSRTDANQKIDEDERDSQMHFADIQPIDPAIQMDKPNSNAFSEQETIEMLSTNELFMFNKSSFAKSKSVEGDLMQSDQRGRVLEKATEIKEYSAEPVTAFVCHNHRGDKSNINVSVLESGNSRSSEGDWKSGKSLMAFSFFDGLATRFCSKFMAHRYHDLILDNVENGSIGEGDFASVLKELDDLFLEETIDKNFGYDSGTCLFSLVVLHNRLIAVNLGNSRCIVSKNSCREFQTFGSMHSPEHTQELNRVLSCGEYLCRTKTDSLSGQITHQMVRNFFDLFEFQKQETSDSSFSYGPWKIRNKFPSARVLGYPLESKTASGKFLLSKEPQIDSIDSEEVDFAFIASELNRQLCVFSHV